MSCDTIQSQLPLMLYGELSFDDEEFVQQHLESCQSCRTQLESVRKLHRAVDAGEPDLPPEMLNQCRRNLAAAVAGVHESGLARDGSWLSLVRKAIPSPGLIWKPAGAIALLATGFLGGRMVPDTGRLIASREPEPVASRVRYVQPEGSDRVQIVVEEVRQRVLEGDISDRRIRGMLVSAAREAHDPGVRVETMDLLKTQFESAEVRRALLAALQHDSNPGVRLKALEALRQSPAHDAETRRVLAKVLLQDQNPGVRTQAIDLLTQKREPAIVGVLQEVMTREDNNYVRLKCQRALSEMNASMETF